jgi:hypothetical protein
MGTVPVIGRKLKKSGNSKAAIVCDLPVGELGDVIDFQVGLNSPFSRSIS